MEKAETSGIKKWEMENAHGKLRNKYLMTLSLIIALVIALAAVRVYLNLIVNAYLSDYVLDLTYISEAVTSLIAIFGAYFIYRLVLSLVGLNQNRGRIDIGSAEIAKLVLRILLYSAIIIIVLTAFGVNLTDALAGGAIGGVVIGLAVQTIVSSILSGILVSSSRTLIPGEVVVLRSSTWGSIDIIGKVTKVSILYTNILLPSGSTMKLPNSILFSSTIFTRLLAGEYYRYTLPVTMNSDVSSNKILESVRAKTKESFKQLKCHAPDIYLTTKNGSTDTYSAIISFKVYNDLNVLITAINNSFDEAYWNLKQPSKTKKSR